MVMKMIHNSTDLMICIYIRADYITSYFKFLKQKHLDRHQAYNKGNWNNSCDAKLLFIFHCQTLINVKYRSFKLRSFMFDLSWKLNT